LWSGWADGRPGAPETETRESDDDRNNADLAVRDLRHRDHSLQRLKHGVLSRYTVLPWEDAAEYRALVAALVAEHAPQGLTEEHLVEEVAGILWRKRRLRLAEAAAHRRGLEDTLSPHSETVKAALVHLGATDQSERVVDALRATASDTEDDIRGCRTRAMTRRARPARLPAQTPTRSAGRAARIRRNGGRRAGVQPRRTLEDEEPPAADAQGCADFGGRGAALFETRRRNWPTAPVREQAFGRRSTPTS
jgi:hypothetical protein